MHVLFYLSVTMLMSQLNSLVTALALLLVQLSWKESNVAYASKT